MLTSLQVALKTITDVFSVLTVEKCLLEKLPGILSPEIVVGLDDKTVKDIAGESEESQKERKSSTDKLKILQDTLQILRRLDRHQSIGKCLPDTSAGSRESRLQADLLAIGRFARDESND